MILGSIADDLTGGVELASMLVAQGVRTSLSIGPVIGSEVDADAHVVALKSRVVPVEEAVTSVLAAAKQLLRLGSRQLFFKYCATFDSTPAGNIGPCSEALLDLLQSDFTIFCPSFCEVGRTVYQGHLFAGAQLLSESPKRFDPLTPMTDSNLLRVLAAQSQKQVGLLPHKVVHQGADAVSQEIHRLRAQGVVLAIADAIYESDLAMIAEACVDLPLITGNSSIAAHLPRIWRRRGLLQTEPAETCLPGVGGHGAVLAGSCAERTAEQVLRFGQQHPVLHLDLADAFGERDLVGHASDWAGARIEQGPVAISTAAAPEAVSRLQDRFGRSVVADKAEAILAQIARHLVDKLDVRRLVVAGGETSGAVLSALGIDQLVVGPYQGPGIARVIAQKPTRMALLLKSGKLGPVEMLAPTLEAMRGTSG